MTERRKWQISDDVHPGKIFTNPKPCTWVEVMEVLPGDVTLTAEQWEKHKEDLRTFATAKTQIDNLLRSEDRLAGQVRQLQKDLHAHERQRQDDAIAHTALREACRAFEEALNTAYEAAEDKLIIQLVYSIYRVTVGKLLSDPEKVIRNQLAASQPKKEQDRAEEPREVKGCWRCSDCRALTCGKSEDCQVCGCCLHPLDHSKDIYRR